MHYDPEWVRQPLLLLAAGTGLAPLWAILREALRQGHEAPIRLIAVSHAEHYFAAPLQALAERHPDIELSLLTTSEWGERLGGLRIASRGEIAWSVAARVRRGREPATVSRRAARRQLFSDCFVGRNEAPA